MVSSYTAEEARAQFRQRLRRSEVVELGRRFGLSPKTMRNLLEAPRDDEGKVTGPPAIEGIVYPGTTWAYYDRERVLTVLKV